LLLPRLVRGLTRVPGVRSGVTAVAWRNLRPAVYVLTYHRVGNWRETAFDSGTFTCDAERFREHLTVIKERFDVIDLDRLRHQQESGTPPSRPLALITFDDGYRDNYDTAFPILKDMGLSALFFLPTGFIGTSHVPWWDEVAWTIRHARVSRIELPGLPEPIDIDAGDPARATSRVLKWVKRNESMPLPDRVDTVKRVSNPPERPRDGGVGLLLSWDEARTMHRAGMGIGSHTHTHRLLSQLTSAEQEKELADSKEILEGELRAPVDSVAYPVGGHYCYTHETRHLARKLGYRVGFNHTNAVAELPVPDSMDVNRLIVHDREQEERLRFIICFPGASA
jgi:peptidoglycan/xylan/chitin deacetylase (PgdA/CDA1 family)